jgi:hypothetical protein
VLVLKCGGNNFQIVKEKKKKMQKCKNCTEYEEHTCTHGEYMAC